MSQHIENNYYNTLYIDEDIAAVSKAHGLHVIPDRYGAENVTLLSILSHDIGKVFPVHRLDAGTGGVIVFARNQAAHKALCRQFEERKAVKKYLAIASAQIYDQTLMLPIAAGNHGKFKVNFKSGKPAATTFTQISTNGKESAIIAAPISGRTHQIRVHLKALKAPLYQDWLYNVRTDDRKLTLFAYSLLISHPRTGAPLHITAEVSEFMAHTAEALELSFENVYL